MGCVRQGRRRRRNSKLQTRSSREAPNSKPRKVAVLDLAGVVLPQATQSSRSGSPNLKLEVSLELGAWCLEIYLSSEPFPCVNSSEPHFLLSITATLLCSSFCGTTRNMPPEAIVCGITSPFCFTSTAQNRFLCEPVGHFGSTVKSKTTS